MLDRASTVPHESVATRCPRPSCTRRAEQTTRTPAALAFLFGVFARGQGRIRDSAHVANSLHICQSHHRDLERATGHPHGPAAERAARRCTRCIPVAFAIDCPRMDVSETALKEHVRDALRRVAFITLANCWRRLAPKDVYVGFQKMSYVVTHCDVIR